jgi:16S rRNA (guanine966-N2)-methyltransferase
MIGAHVSQRMTRAAQKKSPRTPAASLPNRLRVIGGRWRGTKIDIPPLPAVRPSPDRIRETLFNWLHPVIANARCLDLFAGSGALGLEALSRGASHVVFVDAERAVGNHLETTLRRLGSADATVHVGDALRFIAGGPSQPFNIVFVDPPFASGVLQPVLQRLSQGWLAPGAHVYVEQPATSELPPLPAGWSVHRSKRAGRVGYHLLLASSP